MLKSSKRVTQKLLKVRSFDFCSESVVSRQMNDLPLHIKQSPSVDIFKSRIKTRLFQLAYFIWLCKCMYVYFMLSIMNRLGLTRSYVTCTFASALVSKGQISIWHICLILKLALYKYHIIIIIMTQKQLLPCSVNTSQRACLNQTTRMYWNLVAAN